MNKKKKKKSPKLFGKQVAWNKRGIYRNLSNIKLRRGIICEPAEKNLTTPPESVVNWSFSFCSTCSEARLEVKKLPKINSRKGLLLCAPHKIYFNEIKLPDINFSAEHKTHKRNIISQFFDGNARYLTFCLLFLPSIQIKRRANKNTHITSEKHLLYQY